MEEPECIDYKDISILGIDVEREDTSVGIFGNTFTLVIKDNKTNIQHQIILNDDQVYDLYHELRKLLIETRYGDIE